jgi:hypothetical protein
VNPAAEPGPFRDRWGWLLAWMLLAATLAAGLHLWQSNDPVAEAAGRGVARLEDRIAEFAPEELRTPARRLAELFTEHFVRPHVAAAKILTTGWGLLFGVLIPAGMTLCGAALAHLALSVTGGATGGWRETFRVFAFNRVIAEALSIALVMVVLGLEWGLTMKFIMLFFGLPLIRFGVAAHLTIALCEAHRLGALRVILLAVPGMLLGGALTALLALIPAALFWLHCALAALLAP